MGKNRTRDSELGAIVRELLMVEACENIQLLVRHVSGESKPIADTLSRVHMGKSVQCKDVLLLQLRIVLSY